MSKDYHEKSTVSKTIKNIKRYYRRRKGIILAVLMIIIVVLVTVIFLQMKSKKTLATAPNLPVVEENEISENPLEGKVCVCFGDSITANMQPPNDYPTILAKETGMKVYNLGVGGTRMSVHPESDYGAFSFFHIADSIVTNDYKLQKKAKKSETISYIAETKYNALKSIDWSKVDYITICYGANDIKEWSNPMDDPNNPKSTDTFIGALRYSIERIQMEYPHIKIIIMTPLFRYWSDTGEYSDEQ